MDELYLDNIDEYVNDQNKIVTYKWLSLTLGIHVNTAKQMLYHYLEQRRKERSGNSLHATYLVSGKCMENGSMCHKVSVVREDKLEDMKSKLDVTISVHVYSVQRAELKDSAPLYSTDYDAVKENLKNCSKYSAIRCAAAVPMSSAELRSAQEKVTAAASPKEPSKPVLNSSTTPPTKASKPKGIMVMFSNKAGPKKEEQSREVKTEQKEDAAPAEAAKAKPSSKANAMNHFFGKSADKKSRAEQTDKSIKEEAEGGVASAGGSTKLSEAAAKSPADIKEEQPKESSAVKETKDIRNKTKRLEHSDSEDERTQSQKKKRRRIKKPQSDSSDDEVIPDSPPVPEVHTPSPVKHVKKEPLLQQNSEGRRRKRRRVLKSRTFVDEEGCIVTEKGYETESYSESDDDLKGSAKPCEDSSSQEPSQGKKDEEEKVKEKAPKKAAASKPTKQASIMGFFQKK